jgi:hypothetical protein
MARDDEEENKPAFPPRVKAAFQFLYLARLITEQVDASIPMRELTPLERRVEEAALRALQQYLLGEMDFTEAQEPKAERSGNDEPGKRAAEPTESSG